ncbi:fibronectin type III domain-containing protein [Flavivirga algicola]|uniref:Fibronectin type III domain-containing protein n=1 Tax=Flavivirga algicola TaxID=2729136 RepID=A0ABX1RZW0_9FLAO|nr:fibronectin type III domain-containing protein [Flavivirga algicola]NMH89144.1 fibronectin type III domain-containing protein [Flavivirga algicola]
MNKTLILITLMTLWASGCGNDDNGDLQIQNQNPKDFSVEATEITNNSTLLKWSPATDPEGDVVTYTIFLEQNEVQSQLQTTEFLLENLVEETNYSGKVVASDGKNGASESTFSFTTTETINSEIAIAWQKSLGGTLDEEAYSIRQTNDLGYIVVGASESNNGDVGGNKGNKDCWVVKLDSQGVIQWETNIGGTNNETAHDVQQTNDGGYIIGAFSSSNDGNVAGNHGMRDFWIVKLNASGNISWKRNLGGSKDDILEAIIETSNGEFVAVGYTSSDSFNVKGQSDAWIVKLDESGTLLWETNFGGSQRDLAFSVDETSDQGCIVAGYTETTDNKRDMLVIKLDNEGKHEWNKTYTGSENEEAASIQQTNDGGYIIGGYSKSSDGDIGKNNGANDALVIKTDNQGNIIWKKVLGGSKSDGVNDIKQTTDGGYIAAGSSTSDDLDVAENHGGADFWILRLQASGDLVWQQNLGGEGNDYAFSIEETKDGGFITTGSWYTNITGNGGGFGDFNYWVIKLE